MSGSMSGLMNDPIHGLMNALMNGPIKRP